MAISVDPITFVISIPKADLTLVQSTPTEIYNMDLNWFRLQLKDWEDDGGLTGGITFLKTHTHNTEVSLGGLTFARVIEILDPYTVTFENGYYAVNLVGANSNVGDKTNVNNVSVRSQNSAGLISSPLIEFASFEGGIWWDPTNSTGKADYGTLFPLGTRLKPTRDLADVKLIANFRGLNKVYVMGIGSLDQLVDFTEFIFEGQTHVNNSLIVESIVNVNRCVFRDLSISGVLDGGNELSNCVIEDLEYVNGHIHNCGLIGSITLAGGLDAVIANCITIDPYDPPTINMGTAGQNLAMPNYSGIVYLENMTGTNFAGIGLSSGQVILKSTVVSGTIHVSGNGTLTDESGNTIFSGVWNGNVTIINQAMSKEIIAELLDAGVSLTPEQATQLQELYKLQGLDINHPMTVTPTLRSVDDIDLELSGDGTNITIVTRQ